MHRRTFLTGAGALTMVAAGGGLWRAHRQGVFRVGEGAAYEPWRTWRADADDRALSLVRAAVLAASPHNTQPWLFRVTETGVELYADMRRNLGAFDPYLREMYLGLGCALENLVLAAANSSEADVTLEPGLLDPPPDPPEPTLVARVEVRPGARRHGDLHEAIPLRHTHRGPYDIDRPLPPELVEAMGRMADGDAELQVFVYTADDDRARFGDVVVAATEAIIADVSMVHDSERWFRHSRDDVQRFRDGVTTACRCG